MVAIGRLPGAIATTAGCALNACWWIASALCGRQRRLAAPIRACTTFGPSTFVGDDYAAWSASSGSPTPRTCRVRITIAAELTPRGARTNHPGHTDVRQHNGGGVPRSSISTSSRNRPLTTELRSADRCCGDGRRTTAQATHYISGACADMPTRSISLEGWPLADGSFAISAAYSTNKQECRPAPGVTPDELNDGSPNDYTPTASRCFPGLRIQTIRPELHLPILPLPTFWAGRIGAMLTLRLRVEDHPVRRAGAETSLRF